MAKIAAFFFGPILAGIAIDKGTTTTFFWWSSHQEHTFLGNTLEAFRTVIALDFYNKLGGMNW